MTDGSKYRRLCIVTPLDLEFNLAAGLLSQKSFFEDSRLCRGIAGNRQITVMKSGMRATGFAERLEDHLKGHSHDALIVAGLAGGLDPQLKVGDPVVYDLCLDARTPNSRAAEPARDEIVSFASDVQLLRFVDCALQEAGLSPICGAGVTVEHVITEAGQKLALAARYAAKAPKAVDMETFDIWATSVRFGIPVAAVRVVSDDAGVAIPDFNRAYRADGSINPVEMAAVMLARPAVTVRFLSGLRPAMKSFRKSLKVLFNT